MMLPPLYSILNVAVDRTFDLQCEQIAPVWGDHLLVHGICEMTNLMETAVFMACMFAVFLSLQRAAVYLSKA